MLMLLEIVVSLFIFVYILRNICDAFDCRPNVCLKIVKTSHDDCGFNEQRDAKNTYVREKETDRQIETERYRQTEKDTCTKGDRETYTVIETKIETETDRQTGRHTKI